ncbi:MAG TPA: thioredoxin fold domain-containing protein [Burkholderiales bacterium]|nr:thioredoxin fold domain-containing protein [Burkholderiales bacterium]
MNRIARLACLVAMLLAAGVPVAAQSASTPVNPGPQAIDIPPWFKETFLDFREDIREAAGARKRLMLYFGQDGCPYCRELMRVNFSQKDIVDKTRRHFDAIALNIWGDREVTWLDGKTRSEKAFAAFLKVQFTPTLLFFDEKGAVVLRLNGYYPPHKFRAALDYVSDKNENKTGFADYLRRYAGEPDSGKLHDQPFFLKPPFNLDRSRREGTKPLAVLFEQKHCAACDEMHAKSFRDKATLALTGKFDMVQLELFGKRPVVTPEGKTLSEEQWGRQLDVAYTPTIVFFDTRGKEVFRIEAYLRPFHFASGFDYVASGAYRTQPSFQRFIQARAEKIRERGGAVKVW